MATVKGRQSASLPFGFNEKFELEKMVHDPKLKVQSSQFYQMRNIPTNDYKAELTWVALCIVTWQKTLKESSKVHIMSVRTSADSKGLYLIEINCAKSDFIVEVNELPHSQLELTIKKQAEIIWSHTIETGEKSYGNPRLHSL